MTTLPGAQRFDPKDFMDTIRRVGFADMQELAASWVDRKMGQLLALPPTDDSIPVLLAKVQGVTEMLRWVDDMRQESESRLTLSR